MSEFNFDGLIGPTHNYAGLSYGNIASESNIHQDSNPKQAALQGLAKMWALAERGFPQAVLPPQGRPNFRLLRQVGFKGTDAQMIAAAAKEAPMILAAAYSAASMWAANAATVSPSADTLDGRVHVTVANLNNKCHRSYEHEQTERVLRAIFHDEKHFAIHPALPATPAFGDEGAANHTRLCLGHDERGVELFVFGRSEFDSLFKTTKTFPARHTLEASQAVARLHGLDAARTLFAQQNPKVIDQGVFHNDVICVGSGRVLFYHQEAFVDTPKVVKRCQEALLQVGAELIPIEVTPDQVSVADAVSSYLFNGQLLLKPNGRMLLCVPQECYQNQAVARYLTEFHADPIDEIIAIDVRQSMQNGGGPACLRLRVVLTDAQVKAMHQGVILTEGLYKDLVNWVKKHYRDTLSPADLADPSLAVEVQTALDVLKDILKLRV